MYDDMLAKFVVNFLCIILFFSMDFLLLNNKKPLFCGIIKLQDKIKKQNRGVLYMLSNISLKHTATKSNTLNLHVVNKLEQVAQQAIHKKAVAKAVAKRDAEPPVQQPTGEKLADYSANTDEVMQNIIDQQAIVEDGHKAVAIKEAYIITETKNVLA
jgi:hypothetical protein